MSAGPRGRPLTLSVASLTLRLNRHCASGAEPSEVLPEKNFMIPVGGRPFVVIPMCAVTGSVSVKLMTVWFAMMVALGVTLVMMKVKGVAVTEGWKLGSPE